MGVETVPAHSHITVDEDTYWGLMYLHVAVRRLIADGELPEDLGLFHLSSDAEARLQQSRAWNAADPDHAKES